MSALRHTATFTATLGLLLSGFGAISAHAEEPAEGSVEPTIQSPMSDAKWISPKARPANNEALYLAANFVDDEDVKIDTLRHQTPAKWFIEDNKYIRSMLHDEYLDVGGTTSDPRPILTRGKKKLSQEWVLSKDEEGYDLVKNAANPDLNLVLDDNNQPALQAIMEKPEAKDLWLIEDASTDGYLHEGRSVAIRPTGKRDLAIDTPGSQGASYGHLSQAYDVASERWKIFQINGSYAFQNQKNGRFLMFKGGLLETDYLDNQENGEGLWKILDDPIGTVELSPRPGGDHIVMGVTSDQLKDGGKPSKIPRGSKEAKFDLTDAGGAYGHMSQQQISPQANPAMGINIPSGRGDQAYLWANYFGPIAHWSQELGTYVFKTNSGNMAWDSSKGNKVINWPGDYSDMRWIPRVTRNGTILVNYKDQNKVLAFTGTDGAVGDPIIVDDFKDISQQYWTVHK